MDLEERGRELVDSVHLAQDRSQKQTLVNKEMNIRCQKKPGNILTSRAAVISEEGVSSMGLGKSR
jgi:hypothetical protein